MILISETTQDARGGLWQIAWLGRHLVLVPEAVLLPIVVCLHSVFGQPPLFALLGLLICLLFVLRTALLALGGFALDRGRYERAAWLARWSLRIYPWSADGLALLGLASQLRGQHAEAAALLRQALMLYPSHGGLHAALSASLAEVADHDGARAHALYALLVSPRRAWGYLRLATIALRVDHSVAEAAGLARHGIRLSRNTSELLLLRLLLAECALSQGDVAAADAELEHVEALLRRAPVSIQAEALFRIGLLRRGAGDDDRCAQALRQVELVDPEGRFVGPAWRARHARS